MWEELQASVVELSETRHQEGEHQRGRGRAHYEDAQASRKQVSDFLSSWEQFKCQRNSRKRLACTWLLHLVDADALTVISFGLNSEHQKRFSEYK